MIKNVLAQAIVVGELTGPLRKILGDMFLPASIQLAFLLKLQATLMQGGRVSAQNKLLKFVPALRASTGQPNLRFVCRLARRYVSELPIDRRQCNRS
jgi:hypothetical protein